MRLAVERAFIIIGEALMQAQRLEPALLSQSISSLRQIVGFRNVLVHGYAVVLNQTVWDIVNNDVAKLTQEVDALLATMP